MIRRLLASIVTLWLVVSLIFLIFFVLPGGTSKKSPGGFSPVTQLLAGRVPGAEIRERIQEELGLNRPVIVQYRDYLWRLAHGDLGVAYRVREDVPVWPLVRSTIRPTVELALGASAIFLGAGLALGVLAAIRPRWLSVRSAMAASYFFVAMPSFAVGAFLLVLLSFGDMYPVGAYRPMAEGVWNWTKPMIAPWFVLALPFIPMYARLVRGGLKDAAGADYIRTAEAKGLGEREVVRQELRASITPVVTLYGLNLGALLGGSVVVETVFEVPGMGLLISSTAFVGDFPVVAGVTIVASVAVILSNLAVDLAYAWIDPRVRLQ